MQTTYYAKFPTPFAGRLDTVTAKFFDNAEVQQGATLVGTGNTGVGTPAPGDGVIYETSSGGYAVRATHADGFEGTIRWNTGGTDAREADQEINALSNDPAVVAILAAISNISGGSAIADGNVPVDADGSNTTDPGESVDALAYKTGGGVGIDDADVLAYRKSEYEAGNYQVRARTRTDSDGRFPPLMLDEEKEYVLYYVKHGAYGPNIVTITTATAP